MQILAATDFSTRSNRALRQAGLLAQASNADLALVHVVDDDQPEALVDMEKREAERILAEQVSVMAELRGVKCRPTVVSGAPFAGILQTAASMRADLVVMGVPPQADPARHLCWHHYRARDPHRSVPRAHGKQ